MSRTSSKRVVVVAVVVIYTWLYVFNTDSEIRPEELEQLKSDLADWVHENEEELRHAQEQRREVVQQTCRRYLAFISHDLKKS